MPLISPDLPTETDVLCEGCGYRLNGLPPSSNCPECGRSILTSTADTGRSLPPWETIGKLSFASYFSTCAEVILRPVLFFKHLVTRHSPSRSVVFASISRSSSALLMALGTSIHLSWCVAPTLYPPAIAGQLNELSLNVLHLIILWPLIWAMLTATSWAATRLTALESKYHGLRLPLFVVDRLMNYHSACYLPVSLAALLFIATSRVLIGTGTLNPGYIVNYLYMLCAFVVFAAAYLFWSYWAAMKNAMFANV